MQDAASDAKQELMVGWDDSKWAGRRVEEAADEEGVGDHSSRERKVGTRKMAGRGKGAEEKGTPKTLNFSKDLAVIKQHFDKLYGRRRCDFATSIVGEDANCGNKQHADIGAVPDRLNIHGGPSNASEHIA